MITHNNIERLNAGERLATEVTASSHARRGWVSVSPYKVEAHEDWPDNPDALPWRFRVMAFEIDRSFDYRKYDLHPEYIDMCHDWKLGSIDAVSDKLRELGLDLDLLDYPDRCDYPL